MKSSSLIKRLLNKTQNIFRQAQEHKADEDMEKEALDPHDLNEVQIEEALAQIKVTKRGFKAPYPELEELYKQCTEYAFQKIEDHRIYKVEPIKEGELKGEVFTWCGLYRFKVLEGQPWVLFKRDLEQDIWVETSSVEGFKFPEYNILPIFVKSKEESYWDAFGFVESSLKEFFEKSGFYRATESDFTKNILKNNGILSPQSDECRKLPNSEKFKASEYYHKEKRKIDVYLYVIKNILIEKIAGRRASKKSGNLHGVEMAKRGFGRQFWKMVDKSTLNVAVTMYWRKEVSINNWLKITQHQDALKEIAQSHRGLLPLLSKISSEYWHVDKITNPAILQKVLFDKVKEKDEFFADSLGGKNSFESSSLDAQSKEKYTQIVLNSSVSINHFLQEAGCFNISPATHPPYYLFDWLDIWRKEGLPLFVQGFLLKNHSRLNKEKYVILPSSKFNNNGVDKVIDRSNNWMKEWVEGVKIIMDYHKTQTGARSLQKKSHVFWPELLKTFNKNYLSKKDVFEQNESFLDELPLDHPWKPYIQKVRMEKMLDKNASVIGKKGVISKKRL